MLDDIPTIIYRIEHEGGHVVHVIDDCNQAALNLFHTTEENFIGRRIVDFLDNPDFRGLATLRGDVLDRHENIQNLPVVRYQWRRDDGTTFLADANTGRRILMMLLNPREE